MSNLLNDASLIVTPNAYKEGKLYSVIPSDGSGDMSVTRATTATRVNSAGLVELVPYNLFSYSEQFNNAYWEKGSATISANAATAPNGTLTADKFQEIATNDTHQIYIAYTGNIGVATISLYAKKAERSAIQITSDQTTDPIAFFNLDTGVVHSSLNCTPFIENVGNGWYRCGITYTVDQATSYPVFRVVDSNFNTTYTGTAGYGVYIWGAQLNDGTLKPYQKTETRLNIPRLDYSLGGCPSLLVEPQRTNVLAYSNNFTLGGGNWFNFSGANPIANQGISPDGINNAWTLPSNSTLTTEFGKTIGQAIGDKVTASIYAKGSETAFNVYIQNVINTDILGTVTVNLTTGLITSGSGNVQNMGNGWYRISVTGTSTITNGFARPTFKNPNSACLIYGAQYEAGSYPTSYIPTTSATVTRNADVISKTGISSLIGQTEGTIFLDLDNIPYNSDWLTLNPISGSPYTNGIGIGYYSSSVRLQLYSPSGIITPTITAISGRNKIAIGYKSGDTVIYINGVNVFSSAGTFSFGVLLDSITVGSSSWVAGSTATNKIYSHSLYNTRLTNSELIQLTTP